MDKTKLIIIIAAVAVVISLGVSVFSVVTLTSALKNISNPNAVGEEGVLDIVPLDERVEFKIVDPLIAQYTKIDSDGNKRILNISMKVGVSFNTNEKDYDDILALMGKKEDIIRDRISSLLSEKNYDFMLSDESNAIIKREILEILKVSFNTDSIIEVYGETLKSSK